MEQLFKNLAIANESQRDVGILEQTGGTGLLSLPSELLDKIVDYLVGWTDELRFRFNRCQTFGSYEEEPAIRSAYKLRLVCKRLCDVANRVFMPALRIRLSEASLTRAEEIIRHVHISQNIRTIELLLDYRADNIASDFNVFFSFKVGQICDLERNWEEAKNEVIREEYEKWTPGELDERANELYNTKIKDIPMAASPSYSFWYPTYSHDVMAFERWKTVFDSWEDERNQTEQTYARDDPKRKLLREGFTRFQALHQEQHRLVTSGEFLSRLATICSRMPNLRCLIFSDKEHDEKGSEADWIDLKSRVMFDDEKMLALLASPVPWTDANKDIYTGDAFYPHITASQLIWDVPIALHREGVKLRSLNLRCFPVRKNYAADMLPTDDNFRLLNNACDQALVNLDLFSFALEDDRPSLSNGVHVPYENGLPDLVSSRETHMVDYIARRVRNPRLNQFELTLPESKRDDAARPKNLHYSYGWYEEDAKVLLEMHAAHLQNADVYFDAPEDVVSQLQLRLRELSEQEI